MFLAQSKHSPIEPAKEINGNSKREAADRLPRLTGYLGPKPSESQLTASTKHQLLHFCLDQVFKGHPDELKLGSNSAQLNYPLLLSAAKKRADAVSHPTDLGEKKSIFDVGRFVGWG